MDEKQPEKMPKAAPKSFMTVGPTLHYSHENVQRCWLLAVVGFSLNCLFWSRVVTGSFLPFDFEAVSRLELWRLDQFSMTGVSIFEYPWQIVVLGLLMGIMAVVPVLISQLMSFRYSLLFILAVFFLANLPGFAFCLLISCIAAACRPVRFRSRFVAIALCMAPQFLYWGYFGGARGAEPTILGFSFAPWLCAWIVGLGIAGLVLGIGHFTRYRPGLVWTFTTTTLLATAILFEVVIGSDELDYQLHVARNNPEEASEFHDHSITEALNKTIEDPVVRRYLAGFFYPTEPIPLRAELKKEIQIQLSYDLWPTWFIVPDELQYQQKRQWLNEQYDLFIDPPKPWWMPSILHRQLMKKRAAGRRMPIALYYKALLSEYSPDVGLVREKEVLHFYSDYPHERSREIWYRLYGGFGGSDESLEARWRIAKHYAGRGLFTQADKLAADAQTMLTEHLERLKEAPTGSDTFFSPFRPPAESVMTESRLADLQRRLDQLRVLTGPGNRTGKAEADRKLATFVMLDPHSQDYSWHLEMLLEQLEQDSPLRDNILLAQTKLVADEQRRAEKLAELHNDYQGTDGGMQALYELGLLKRRQWSQQDDANQELKKKLLAETRAILTSFISLYPNSIYAEQVKRNLDSLPTVE